MNQIHLKARAKINIAIDVKSKLENGYHDLSMIMQSVALYDAVSIKKVNKKNYLKLITNLPWLPCDERNLVYRAAEFMQKQYSLDDGLYIELNKRIPVSGGLGGGSSDCAAVLYGIRKMYGLQISRDELSEIGKTFGADVPYCLMRGTALAQGIGEKLTRLRPFPSVYVLLAKPPIIVSTADIFKNFSFEKPHDKPDIEKLISFIEEGNLAKICTEMKNSLESVTAVKYPIINQLKKAMLDKGAAGSMMSGSGPTVFGLFKDREKMHEAYSHIRKYYPTVREIYASEIFNTPITHKKTVIN